MKTEKWFQENEILAEVMFFHEKAKKPSNEATAKMTEFMVPI